MRLFIAINFNEELKSKIYDEELKIEEKLIRGHITKKENLHLTLVFIGETNKPKEISDIINDIDMDCFNILVNDIGSFNRLGKKLFYLNIKNNDNLAKIYNKLYNELSLSGFNIEEREFKPHVTLAREAVLSDKVDNINLNYSYRVTKISLMESKRINGELKYVELFYKVLK